MGFFFVLMTRQILYFTQTFTGIFLPFEPSITSYNAKQLEKVVFLPVYLYKERVSKALSFVIS